MVPRDVALPALRRRLAIEDHRAQPDATELLAHLVRAPRLGPDLAAREIHAQELSGIPGLGLGRSGLLLRSFRRRCRHTATGVSPGALDGRPRTVSGRSVCVVFDAMYAVFTSNGFRLRWSLKRPIRTP